MREHRVNGFAIQRAGIQSNNYSSASSIVHLWKPNPAPANFNSSLLKLLLTSWPAVKEERETQRWTEIEDRTEEYKSGGRQRSHDCLGFLASLPYCSHLLIFSHSSNLGSQHRF